LLACSVFDMYRSVSHSMSLSHVVSDNGRRTRFSRQKTSYPHYVRDLAVTRSVYVVCFSCGDPSRLRRTRFHTIASEFPRRFRLFLDSFSTGFLKADRFRFAPRIARDSVDFTVVWLSATTVCERDVCIVWIVLHTSL